MRLLALVLLATPAAAWSQSQAVPATATAPAQIRAPLPSDVTAEDRAIPLAAAPQDERILSENESYNLQRVTQGRLGVRLGNNMSYRLNRRK